MRKNRQLALGFVGVAREGGNQRPRRRKFVLQQADARVFIERSIVDARTIDRQDLGDGTLVHLGILAQVQVGQMEAKKRQGAAQAAQATAREEQRTVFGERPVDHFEVGGELRGRSVRRRVADGLARSFQAVECACGGRQAGIEAGDRTAVGFVVAMRVVIGRALGECRQLRRHLYQQGRGRQPGTELVQLLQIERHDQLTLGT